MFSGHTLKCQSVPTTFQGLGLWHNMTRAVVPYFGYVSASLRKPDVLKHHPKKTRMSGVGSEYSVS